MDFIRKFSETINRYGMIQSRDRIGAAVSGGPDSMALLHGLVRYRESVPFTLAVLHLNHGLRQDRSDGDEAFVRGCASDLGLPFLSERIRLHEIRRNRKGSLEELGREERYRFFSEAERSENLEKIALGHHRDDQVETVLMNFLRGSGLRGLRGMEPVREGRYIRPLIETSRKEILAFLEGNGIPFRRDETNGDLFYRRNRIRHDLLPILEERYNENIRETITRAASVLREENDFLERAARRAVRLHPAGAGGERYFPVDEIAVLHPALQRRVIRHFLEESVGEKRQILFSHVAAVLGLVEGTGPDGELHFPRGVVVTRQYGLLRIEKREIPGRPKRGDFPGPGLKPSFVHPVRIPGHVEIPEIGRAIRFDPAAPDAYRLSSKNVVFFDFDKTAPPLFIRGVQPGDRIRPLGGPGTRKVRDILMDEKVPRQAREKVPLVVDSRGVLWVAGHRLSDRVKITGETKRSVRAEMI